MPGEKLLDDAIPSHMLEDEDDDIIGEMPLDANDLEQEDSDELDKLREEDDNDVAPLLVNEEDEEEDVVAEQPSKKQKLNNKQAKATANNNNGSNGKKQRKSPKNKPIATPNEKKAEENQNQNNNNNKNKNKKNKNKNKQQQEEGETEEAEKVKKVKESEKETKETEAKPKREKAKKKKKKKIPGTTIEYKDIREGEGAAVKKGDKVGVYYIGQLAANTKVIFDKVLKGSGFDFKVGAKEVIKGWDLGVVGMKGVGSKRKLWIPADYAYGNESNGKIPGMFLFLSCFEFWFLF